MFDKKEKRVTFSIFRANSLEEMQQLRLEREKELLNLINMKNQVNESYKAVLYTYISRLMNI
jgi:hypothetical protein